MQIQKHGHCTKIHPYALNKGKISKQTIACMNIQALYEKNVKHHHIQHNFQQYASSHHKAFSIPSVRHPLELSSFIHVCAVVMSPNLQFEALKGILFLPI
jgi:hypothetical protein